MNRLWGFLVLVAIAVVPAAALVFAGRGDSEPQLEPTQWVPVEQISTTPVVRGTMTVAFVEGQDLLYLGSSGRVTSVLIQATESLGVTHPLVSIDGALVMGYASESPMYRRLGFGDEGDDVATLQRLLRATVVESLEVDGRVGPMTTEAIRMYSERYRRDREFVFDPGWVIWYPEIGLAIDDIAVELGDVAESGLPIAVTRSIPQEIEFLDGSGENIDLPDVETLNLIWNGTIIAQFAPNSASDLLDDDALMSLARSEAEDGIASLQSVRLESDSPVVRTVAPGASIRTTPTGACVVLLRDGSPVSHGVDVGEAGEFGLVEIAGLSPGDEVMVSPAETIDQLCNSS